MGYTSLFKVLVKPSEELLEKERQCSLNDLLYILKMLDWNFWDSALY